jgi:hypothetical protein
MNASLTTLKSASRQNLSQSAVMETELGWQSMGALSFAPAEDEGMSLGWSAMPAYGQVNSGRGNADLVANFVAESRPVSRSSSLTSFWSAVSC